MNPVYLVIIGSCISAMLAMAAHVHNNASLSDSEKRWFILTFLAIAVAAAADCIGGRLDEIPSPPALHAFVKFVEFCVLPFIPALLAFACSNFKTARIVGIVLVAQVVFEIVMLPFGGVIVIDDQGIYHRGNLYLIYVLAFFISFVYLLAAFVQLSRRFKQRDLPTLVITLLVVLICVIPPLINRDIRTLFLGASLCSMLLYIYYEGLVQQDLAEELASHNARIDNMQVSTIIGMANLIESRDGNTGQHVKNTATYVGMIANAALEAGLYPETITPHFVELAQKAAPLHDIGKIGVPDQVLNKPGPLTPEEQAIMQTHASEGGKIVRRILEGVTEPDYTEIAADIASYHHERWDGTGFPEGLKGEEIPVAARIMAIADVYDALVSERVYKDPVPVDEALDFIEKETGTHFDPQLAPLFVECMRKSQSSQ